jgi:hypothetical protein
MPTTYTARIVATFPVENGSPVDVEMRTQAGADGAPFDLFQVIDRAGAIAERTAFTFAEAVAIAATWNGWGDGESARPELHANEELTIGLPGGDVLHLWAHDCPHCKSVDLWRTTAEDADAGNAEAERLTNDTFGFRGWRDGRSTPHVDQSTTILIWDRSAD